MAALLLMAACSSGSVSDSNSKPDSKEKLSADRSQVEAYEQNDTTLSGEQNGKDFVNKLDDTDLVSTLRDGGHVIYLRHTKTVKD